jgi:hypothetical protein
MHFPSVETVVKILEDAGYETYEPYNRDGRCIRIDHKFGGFVDWFPTSGRVSVGRNRDGEVHNLLLRAFRAQVAATSNSVKPEDGPTSSVNSVQTRSEVLTWTSLDSSSDGKPGPGQPTLAAGPERTGTSQLAQHPPAQIRFDSPEEIIAILRGRVGIIRDEPLGDIQRLEFLDGTVIQWSPTTGGFSVGGPNRDLVEGLLRNRRPSRAPQHVPIPNRVARVLAPRRKPGLLTELGINARGQKSEPPQKAAAAPPQKLGGSPKNTNGPADAGQNTKKKG